MEKYEDSRVVLEILIPGDIHTIMDIMALRTNSQIPLCLYVKILRCYVGS